MSHLTGQTIGQYRILEQIGRGGMATVYKAYQPAMERNVAIKVLPQQLAADPTFIERFRQEAKAIARLEHLHILPVYDYGEDQGLTYMVMRYLDSGTLTGRLRQAIEVAEVVRLLGQVAEALDYTHSQGIVHRDIKPSNVLIDSRGEALLTDFGIARMMEGAQGLTGQAIIGTPKYVSPEQAQGQPVDGRSDIYSLGVILYEALVGRPPFEAETPVAVLMKHVNAPLPLPRSINPNISEAMEQVILKALAKAPADRYRTAGDMKRAMQAALTTAGQGLTQFSTMPVAAPPAPTPEPSTSPAVPPGASQPQPLQPNRRALIIGILLLVLVLGGGGMAFWLLQPGAADTPTQTPEPAAAAVERSTLAEPTQTPTGAGEPASTNEAGGTPAAGAGAAQIGEPTQVVFTPTPTPTPPVEPTATPIAAATIAPALPPTPTPVEVLAAVNVTGNPGKSDNPRLLFDSEGILHLVWFDNSRQGKNLGDFLHRQRTPDGEWSAAEYLTDDLDSSVGWAPESLRMILNPAGQVCVFWRGSHGTGGPNIVGIYMRCQAGKEWSTVQQVKNTLSLQNFDIAYSLDGALQIAYSEGGAPANVYINDIILSDGFKSAIACTLAIDRAGGYHAVWVRQGDPFSLEYRYSSDNGQTWQEAERLTDEETRPTGTGSPQLIADGQGNIHLVWKGGGVRYRRWVPDSGWEATIELTRGESRDQSTSLGFTVDADGLAHVVWQGFDGMFYAQQLPDQTWSQPRLIAESFNTGAGPDVAVDARGTRHFVWQVEDDALDLYYAALP